MKKVQNFPEKTLRNVSISKAELKLSEWFLANLLPQICTKLYRSVVPKNENPDPYNILPDPEHC
jgi:hypothetical protein